MEHGIDYEFIQKTSVFELIAMLGSFNRKQELDTARKWFIGEVRKLIEDNKPKDMKSSSGKTIEMKPVNQDLVLDDLIINKFES